MPNQRDNYNAARALVHATLHGDRKAATHYHLSTRTIQNYRQALQNDDELAEYFQQMLEKATDGWIGSMRATLRDSARKLREFVNQANMKDLKVVHEVRMIFSTLSETAVLREALIDEPERHDGESQIPARPEREEATETLGPN